MGGRGEVKKPAEALRYLAAQPIPAAVNVLGSHAAPGSGAAGSATLPGPDQELWPRVYRLVWAV